MSAFRAFRRRGVSRSPDFDRILSLSRVDWKIEADELAALLTQEFARSPVECVPECVCKGTGSMELLPVQAASLAFLHDYGGLIAPITVGGGKTLVSFLAPLVVGASRPLLIVPASMRGKTEREHAQYATHWKIARIRIESYERLGIDANKELLTNMQPDFIFADEGHRLKNTKAAVTRRVARYLRHFQARIAIASGTLTDKSIRDYWHLLKWALGADNMPLPVDWAEMMEWADCLDVQSANAMRTAPGCLVELCNEEELEAVALGGAAELEAVRTAYQRRLTSTPGVVSTVDDSAVNCSITITGVDVELDHVLDPHYTKLRREWRTPDDWEFAEPVELWRHARELVCGFYNVWDPRPPEEWMIKRSRWFSFVRRVLQHSVRYDTEFQVAAAAHKGDISTWDDVEVKIDDVYRMMSVDVYAEWVEIRDSFKPNAVPVWVDDSTLKFAARWMKQNPKHGIVWVEHPCFGEKLEKLSGIPYFGRGGKDKRGIEIESMHGKTCIASVLSSGQGRNLQAWNKNLVVSCYPNASKIQQLLGRTHRQGQEADEVTFDFVLACKEQVVGFWKAMEQARYIKHTMNQPQKLLIASLDVMTLEDLDNARGARWA